jgi:hypothetical protein
MVKCFQVFDKDGNGFVNASELREVSKELGRELDAAEVDECLKDIDKDKDNKISFTEFSKWWLSGRQGLSPLMRNLLAFKITSLKLIDTLSAPMKEVMTDVTHFDAHDISTSSFTLNLNEVKEPGFALDAKLLFLSPSLHKEHLRVRALHSFPGDATVVANLSVEVRHDKVSRIQGLFSELKAFVTKIVPDPSVVSFVFEGSVLNIGFNLTSFVTIGNVMEGHEDIITKVQEELKVDQNVDLSIRFAVSPEELLAEDAEPTLNLLFKGISLSLRVNLWRKISDVLFKIVESGEIDSTMLPYFGGIAPALMLRVNGNLNLTVDQHMLEKLSEHPLMAPLIMNPQLLISGTSNVSGDEEFPEHLKQLKAPEALAHLLEELIDGMSDEVNISITHPQMGLQGRAVGKGLGLVVKNVVKYF